MQDILLFVYVLYSLHFVRRVNMVVIIQHPDMVLLGLIRVLLGLILVDILREQCRHNMEVMEPIRHQLANIPHNNQDTIHRLDKLQLLEDIHRLILDILKQVRVVDDKFWVAFIIIS